MAPIVLYEGSMISRKAQEHHERALRVARRTQHDAGSLLDTVEENERHRYYVEFERKSTYEYCLTDLNLPDELAYDLIRVARRGRSVPQLIEAVKLGLHLSKARRIAPVLTPANQAEWIERARTVSKHRLERALAEVNPRLVERERAKPSAADRNKIEFYTSNANLEALRRAQDVVSTRLGRSAGLEDTVTHLVEAFLLAHDPVVKADRNAHRANASVKTIVFARDRGRCQMKFKDGRRCGQRRFLHLHHKRAKFNGGVDHPDNLITLCASCHRHWHRTYGDVPFYEIFPHGPSG